MRTATDYARIAIAAFSLSCSGAPAFANFSMSPSGTTTLFAIDAANQGTSACAAASTECGATVPINTAGAPLFVTANPGVVSQATAANLNATVVGTGTFAVQAAQSTAANLNATVVGTGTFAVQAAATLNAETTKVIGTTRVTGNIGGVLDAIGQNVTAPANWLQAGCQFNTSPTTISSGSGSPCQMDAAGNILVNVKSATGVAENTAVGTLTFSVLGGEGLSTEKTAVTTGNYGRLVTDLVGKIVTMPYAPNQLWVKGTTAAMTGTTSTQLIAAVASNRIYLSTLTCGNSHATVGTFVNVQDGSGGTTLWSIPAAAVYGGTTLNFQPPIATTNGNGVYVADATTGANVICSGGGYSGV